MLGRCEPVHCNVNQGFNILAETYLQKQSWKGGRGLRTRGFPHLVPEVPKVTLFLAFPRLGSLILPSILGAWNGTQADLKDL
jgi:hypothetical protein